MENLSKTLLILSIVQFFFTPPGIGIGLFFGLLIAAGVCGEAGMTPDQQKRLLASRREMDRHGASH